MSQWDDGGQWLASNAAEGLARSLQGMTGEPFSVRLDGLTESAPAEAVYWREQVMAGETKAGLWIGVVETVWDAIGKKALDAAGLEDSPREDRQSTWNEIAGQALSSATQALARRVRNELSGEASQDATLIELPFRCAILKLDVSGVPVSCYFGRNQATEALWKVEGEPAKTELAATTGLRSVPQIENSRTLDLLLEVKLPVCVSFGRAHLPLKDVLKLNSGSIVELNRSIVEPVDIIVNNCVIARGEVVVVEGNYGVRIKKIISKEERLRTLY